ncbi:MAG: methyltransferase domain-containing protein [Gammaproteobacteria bacterium]|nr:methyltransferase domain-containing protein [Gammaproteobacteria bacterium]
MVDKTCHFKANTRYNSISIETDYEYSTLRTANDDLQSRINRKYPERLALDNLIYLSGILLFIPPPKDICLLGTGAGCLIHFFRHHYPDSHITAIDIDAELLEIMQEHMALPTADDHLTYIIDDAAHYLKNNQQQFDLILLDLFLGDQSPDWLLQKDSMQQLFSMLKNQGGVGYNLLIDSEKEFTYYYKCLRKVFQQQTLCLPVKNLDNILTFAFRQPAPARNMSKNLEKAMVLSSQLDLNYMEILSEIYSTNPTGSGVI